jgi:xanthine/CO dehydrogenase XdhC/CoxF family maturation factor
MTELEQIATVWQAACDSGETGILATVVRVEGSSYRAPGARLLITSGGRRAGSVSGGCLEADLQRKAWWITDRGPVIRRYDTSIDGELSEGFGLGCNGVIDVLIERLPSADPPLFDAVRKVARTRQPAWVATAIHTDSRSNVAMGERAVVFEGEPLPRHFVDSGCEIDPGAPPRSYAGSGHAEFFVESVTPPYRLLVFGAGDDAIPLVRLACLTGFETVVLDGRSHFARAERFPSASRVETMDLENPLSGIHLDPWTVAVVMSHSLVQDTAAVRALTAFEIPYIGILGPRKRTERLLAEIEPLPGWFLGVLHSPMGLDIGADGAEQIALAAIAELQAVLKRRAGGTLRAKVGPIRPSMEEYPLPVACPMG